MANFNKALILPQTEAEALGLIRTARLWRNRQLKILTEKRSKSLHDARRFARAVLSDQYVALATLESQLKGRGKFVGDSWGVPCLDVVHAACELNPWLTSDEPTYRIKALRKNGKIDWFHKLEMVETVRNRMAIDVAERICLLHPRQFIRAGGPPARDRWLEANLSSASFVLTTDIPDCFGTIKRSQVLSGLLIPKQVTKKALFDPMDRAKFLQPSFNESELVPSHYYDEDNNIYVEVSSAHRGIPKGAALSAIASEVVLKRVLEAVEAAVDGVTAASHGDNLIFLLNDQSAIQPVKNALVDAVVQYFGMDVIAELTRRIQITDKTEWVRFCGSLYRFDEKGFHKHTEQARIDNYMLRLDTQIAEAQTEEDFESAERSLQGWAASQRHSSKALMEAVSAGIHLGEFKENWRRKQQLAETEYVGELLETLPMPDAPDDPPFDIEVGTTNQDKKAKTTLKRQDFQNSLSG